MQVDREPQLSAWVRRLTNFLSDYPGLTVSALICGCAVGLGAMAYSNPLTSDEVFSSYVAALGSSKLIFQALSAGMDTHPPVHYLLLHAMRAVFGGSPLAARLPFLAAELAATLLLFHAVARRLSPLHGIAAAGFFLLTDCVAFSYSGRPYALLLLFYVLTFWFWQSTLIKPRTALALTGLCIATALAVSTHFYGAMVTLPIAVGEAWRTWEHRKLRLGVWVAMAAGVLAMGLWVPQIRTIARSLGAAEMRHPGSITSPSVPKLVATYTEFLHPALGLTLLAILLAVIVVPREERVPASGAGMERAEIAAAGMMFFLPVVLYLVGVRITGAYGSNYGFMAAIGAALLLPHFASRLFLNRQAPIALLICCLLPVVGIEQLRFARNWRSHPWSRYQLSSLLTGKAVADSDVIVVAHLIPFLQFTWYAPPALRERLVYLADIQEAARFGDPANDIALRQLHAWVDIPVQDFAGFLPRHDSFLVYDWGFGQGWVVQSLLARGARIELVEVEGPHRLLRVHLGSSHPDRLP